MSFKKMQLNTIHANKKKPKLNVVTSMQNKNLNGKHKTTFPSSLDKALFKENKRG